MEEKEIFPAAQDRISRESGFSLARTFMLDGVGDLEKNDFLSINVSDEKADSGLKFHIAGHLGLQGTEISSIHF